MGKPHDRLAYVIYTSGSTGRPKGVRVGHGGIVRLLASQIRAFGLGPGSRSLLYVSLGFDASISDIGTALLAGATLVIASPPPSARDLPAYLSANGISRADLPPALLPRIDPRSLPPCFEHVVIGGEVGPAAAGRAWAERVSVTNVYGPTETTVCTSLCPCDANDWSAPLLGRPSSTCGTGSRPRSCSSRDLGWRLRRPSGPRSGAIRDARGHAVLPDR